MRAAQEILVDGAVRSSGPLRRYHGRYRHLQSIFHLRRDARYQGLAGQTSRRHLLLQTLSRAPLLPSGDQPSPGETHQSITASRSRRD